MYEVSRTIKTNKEKKIISWIIKSSCTTVNLAIVYIVILAVGGIMNIQVRCSGDQEKAIYEHRRTKYPHLIKSSMETYFLQIAKDKIEDDNRGESEKN